MTWLANIFRQQPSLNHPNPEKRVEAVRALPDSAQEEFAKVLADDADLNVRALALERVSQIDAIAGYLDDSQLETRAVELLAEKLETSHPLSTDARILRHRLRDVDDPEALFNISRAFHDPQDQAETLLQATTSELRVAAVQQLRDVQVLQHCERSSRNSDRTVNRITKERLLRYRGLSTDRDEAIARAEKLIERAQKSDTPPSHYDSYRNALEREWNTVLEQITSYDDELAEFGTERLDLSLLRSRFPSRLAPVGQDQGGSQSFKRILMHLQESEPDLATIERCEQQWLDALKEAQPPSEVANDFYVLAQSLRRSLKQLEDEEQLEMRVARLTQPITFEVPQKKDDWDRFWRGTKFCEHRRVDLEKLLASRDLADAHISKRQELQERLTNAVSSCDAIIKKFEELLVKKLEQFRGELTEMTNALDAGALQQARQRERAARDLFGHLPKGERNEARSDFAVLSSRLGQLVQWQGFGVRPKREELCAQIEALAVTPDEPNLQFQQIKSLRKQWNALGQPLTRDEIALQKRYNEAASQAFEVCSAWFEEQARVREENLEKRVAVCDSLETFLNENDWENPDWRHVIHTLRNARNAWEPLRPVDRTKASRTDKRFYKLTNHIQKRIKDQWKVNAQAKEAIIEHAREACEDEAMENVELIERIKELQGEWKAVGSTNRKKEERLWTQFRDYCDYAFDMRNKAKAERRQSIDATIKEAEEFVDSLLNRANEESESRLSDAQIDDARAKLHEFTLPQRIRKRLEKNIDQAGSVLSRQRTRARTQSVYARLRQLLALDKELASYEDRNEAPSDDWFDLAGDDSVYFESRVPLEGDLDALLDVVLRCEIAAGVPSSEEESGRRLELQVESLQQNIGRGGNANQTDARELILDWIRIAHGDNPLRERFERAIDVLLASRSTQQGRSS